MTKNEELKELVSKVQKEPNLGLIQKLVDHIVQDAVAEGVNLSSIIRYIKESYSRRIN